MRSMTIPLLAGVVTASTGGDGPSPSSDDSAKTTGGAPTSLPSAPASAPQADAVPALIAVYGPAGSTGLGSAVFQQDAVSAESLQEAAMNQYRRFVGASWEQREAYWRAGFRALYRRPPGDTRGIDAELHAIEEAALRGVVTAMIDDMEEPAAARQALAAVFDDSAVADLRLYALGDGEQFAGVEVAARRADGRGLFLVLLLD
jgi:hypothetical protein